jgi:hypothetical protein
LPDRRRAAQLGDEYGAWALLVASCMAADPAQRCTLAEVAAYLADFAAGLRAPLPPLPVGAFKTELSAPASAEPVAAAAAEPAAAAAAEPAEAKAPARAAVDVAVRAGGAIALAPPAPL